MDASEIWEQELAARKYANAFRVKGEIYLFVESLGQGQRGVVQLVVNPVTKDLLVRKANHPTWPAPRGAVFATDREASMNDYIMSNMPVSGERPHIAEFVGSSIVRYPARTPAGPDVLSHMSYYKYYNLGNLFNFFFSDNKNLLTQATAARFVHQMLTALAFLYKIGISHTDLHAKNVLVHVEPGSKDLDFYICDFDNAKMLSSLAPKHKGITDRSMSDIYGVIDMTKKIISKAKPGDDSDVETDEGLQLVMGDLLALERLINRDPGPVVQFPDPGTLLAIALQARGVEARLVHAGDVPSGPPQTSLESKEPFLGTKEMMESSLEDNDVVVGPWYFAQVDRKTGRVESVEEPSYLHLYGRGWESHRGDFEDEIDDGEMEFMMD